MTEPWSLRPDDPEACDRCGAKIKTGTETKLPPTLVPPSVRAQNPHYVLYLVCGWCKTYANRERQAETAKETPMTRKCIHTGAIVQKNIRPHAGCVHPTCPNNRHGTFNGDSCPSCRPAGVTPHSLDGIRHQRPRKR